MQTISASPEIRPGIAQSEGTVVSSNAAVSSRADALSDAVSSSHSQWIAWQLADSALPGGGFTHSSGLEASYRLGHVRNPDELEQHLAAQLIQWARGVAPIALLTFRDHSQFAHADRLCDLLLNHPIGNRASRVQGRGLFFAASHAFGLEHFQSLQSKIQSPAAPGHLAPVFGAICGNLNLDEPSTIRLFMFTQLRGVMAAAIRLGIIGPMAGGAMQHRLLSTADRAVQIAREMDPEQAGQTAPFAELFAANHDMLYSRLFQS
jgi:urease accessory protein